MKERGIDANEHILNLKADFSVAYSQDTGQSIRPMSGIREPDIFNPADKSYLAFLQQKYGYADEEAKTGLTPAGWAAHEMDVEKVERLKTGAEGQQDLIDRTKNLCISLNVMLVFGMRITPEKISDLGNIAL